MIAGLETINDIRLTQGVAMIVAASLAIVMMLIKVPHSEHIKKLKRAKNAVVFCYLINTFTFGYTLYNSNLENYELFSALTMLIVVAFSSTILAFSLINLLNYRYVDFSKLLISIFAVFVVSIGLIQTFFNEKDYFFNIALISGVVLFCAQWIYYVVIFDKWYKRNLKLLEKYYDEDEDHKLKWVRFCFILAMLTTIFVIVYMILPKNFIFIYIGFYILFLLYFAGNFISFIGSHKLLLDAFGHWSPGGRNRGMKKAGTGSGNTARIPEKNDTGSGKAAIASEKAGNKPRERETAGLTVNEKIEKSLEEWVKEKKYTEYDKSREEIAEELGTTKEVLHQYFTVNMGKDFRTWRTELRIEEAKRLLTEEKQLSINIIGEMAGFSDRSNFHRQFTKAIGCSPKEYRESHSSGPLS